MRLKARRAFVGLLFVLVLALGAVPSAQAAFNDPLFLMRPTPPPPPALPPFPPPPAGELEGPCGIAVDSSGRVYVSDYYHDAIDLFGADIGPDRPYGYLSQIANVDPIDGPCALALDASGNLYANDFHRSVIGFNPPAVFAGAPKDEDVNPTGLAVDPASERLYVNERDHVSVFDLAGTEVGQLGVDSLGDGYGLAVSRFATTAGDIYVPDASDNTLKAYAPPPALPGAPPVMTIDGSGTPLGHFTSLRDSAVAVDNATGEVYVTDNLQPKDTERPEAVVYVFSASGTYEGRLKYSVVFGLPLGLAVDNSATSSQGRVYLSTSNTSPGGVYAYPPHAASSAAVPLPEPFELGGSSGSSSGDVTESSSAGASPMPLAAPAPLESAPAMAASPRAHKRRHIHRQKHRHHRPGGHNR
jgi:hypothetical protein